MALLGLVVEENPREGVRIMEKEITIACVEDQEEMIELFELILGKKGYKIEGIIGGRQAVERIIEIGPDLILLDIMMPEVDGWMVYHELKSNPLTKDIPVIAVTAKSQAFDKFLGREIAQFEDYISKPFGPGELVKSIKRVLDRKKEG